MNRKNPFLQKLILVCLATFLISTAALPGFGQTITVYFNQVRQEIDGMGGSAAFRQADDLKKFPVATRTEILDLLFSQTAGIGLSMVRNMVGDGSMSEWGNDIDGPIETIEPQNGVWNFNAVDEQIWFMKEAEARGCTRFFSTVWSPPRWMKTNNSCINGGSVITSMYDEYAEYLYQYVYEYMKNRNGIDIYAISVANEPDMSTGYSSCRWTGDQFRNFVRDYMGPRFSGSTAKIMIGEESNWTESSSTTTLNDSTAVQYLDIVGTHAYGSPSYNPFTTAGSKNKKVWMTEVSNLGTNDTSMTDGKKWAKQIHSFFTNAEGNSWCYWWTICYKVSPARGEGLININTSNQTYYTNKRLYTMGNYSRFIRPGWYRISTSTASSSGVLVSAFKNPDTNDFAIVAINDNSGSQTRSFALDGYSVDSVIPYTTSSTSDLAQGSAIPVSNGTFSASLPGNSVTTFIAGGEIPSTPTPVVTETPTPVVTETPTPVITETPTPVITEAPTPEITEPPTPEPTPELTPAPGVLPWTETFDSEPGGRFSINRQTRTWSSENIDISGATVKISAEIEGDNATVMEVTDYLNLYYSIDGGAMVAWSQNTDGFTLKTVSVNGLSGNSLQVHIEGATSYADETYYVDNITVEDEGVIPPTPAPTPDPTPVQTPDPTPVQTPEPGGNLALNKPVVVSGNSGYASSPGAAVDGNTSTRWASAWSDPQWIYVDLGSTYNITRVVLNWHSNYGVAYQIQVSDDASSWTDIYSTTTGNGGIDDLSGLSGTGRYVRMYGTKRVNSWAYSLYELEVYGYTP